MTVLIEDSPRRNLTKWIEDAHARGTARGAVLTPWATSWDAIPGSGGCRSAVGVAQQLHAAGAEVWFDATTHALQMSGVGDFQWYDAYDLWGGARGDLSTFALRDEHLRRVFETQDRLGARHLAPTVLLHHPESVWSQVALDLAQDAVDQDPTCWLSIAGTAPFWSSGAELDAHIGALAQLEPAGWFLTVARPILDLPVETAAAEVHGLCRTARALAEYAPVHISHGDLAALPAVAAGAYSVGSGWDQRQRVCAFTNYSAREPSGGGGGWYKRPTYRGLLGSLTTSEAAVLARRDVARSTRLGPPPPPGPKEAFLHHLGVLHGAATSILAQPTAERRYRELSLMYVDAALEWPDVVAITKSRLGAAEWIVGLASGLDRYGAGEGW